MQSSLRCLLSMLLFALTSWSSAAQPPMSASLTLSKGSDGHRYWVIFYARPINVKHNHFQHAFVGWKVEDLSSHAVAQETFGIYANSFGKALFEAVPATLVNDDLSIPEATRT